VETKGEFGGLGIEIVVKDGLLTVIAPIEDSPAARAGMQPGDQIIKIGDEFTKELALVDAVKKMRGPKGTPITLSVHREGVKELIPLTVIRDIIKVKSVRFRELGDGFGYIRLAQFQEGSSEEFWNALRELEKKADKKIRGLVIDLRNDPGGLLQQAIRVADIFLKDGVIVYTDGRLESQKQKYFAHDDGTEPAFPMIVLVNGGSASASEIVAGALQDSGRALILGEQSFGKGSVQTILPMDNGAALRLTTALYYTKSGRSIQAQGITPDVIVSSRRYPRDSEELLEEDEKWLKEKDLPHAIRNPGAPAEGGSESTPPASPNEVDTNRSSRKAPKDPSKPGFVIGSRAALEMKLQDLLREDPQLDEALRLLKSWHVFKDKPGIQAQVRKEDGSAVAARP
jgi:carboxyl-terminal processing protease